MASFCEEVTLSANQHPPPAFLFYWKDYLSSTRARMLGAFGRGVYVDMLCHNFGNGSVPNDPRAAAAISGEPLADVEAIWPQLQAMFDLVNGVLKSPKLEYVRAENEKRREAKAKAGRASGLARRRKKERPRKPLSDSGVEHRSNETRTEHEPASASSKDLRSSSGGSSRESAREKAELPTKDQQYREPERSSIAARGGSIPKTLAQQWEVALHFLTAVGFTFQEAMYWKGRIGPRDMAVVARELPIRSDWPDYDSERKKKAVIQAMNIVVRRRDADRATR